jgi:hypothetical protein
MAKDSQCITMPENTELSQIIIKPPEAPLDGIKT